MRNRDIESLARELSARQYDVFSLEQLSQLPGANKVATRRVRAGEWTLRAPGIYGLGVRMPTWRTDLMVAHLRAGLDSVVSFESAAALSGLDGFPVGPLVLTVRHPSHRSVPGCVIHQTRVLPNSHTTTRAGFPVTTLPRTLVDLASVTRRSRLGHALEGAIVSGKVTASEVGRCSLELGWVGRRGMVMLTDLLEDLGPGTPTPGSVLETMFLSALRAAGEPLPHRQYPHPGRLPTPGCVDFAYPAACLICELDGRRWHTRRQDIQRDRARDNAAALAGWDTIRVLWEDLRDWPEETVATASALRVQREAVIRALHGLS